MTACKFSIKENALTTISGADAGTYAIKNNIANILISAVTSSINPFDTNKVTDITDNTITINI